MIEFVVGAFVVWLLAMVTIVIIGISFRTGVQEFRCRACGILFAADTELVDLRRDDGLPLHCPNGHKLAFDLGYMVPRLKSLP